MPAPRRLVASAAAVAVALAVVGAWVWHERHSASLPGSIVVSHGRLEAVQVEVATKFAGRIAAIRVDEGDRVRVGQVVARMDGDGLSRSAVRTSR